MAKQYVTLNVQPQDKERVDELAEEFGVAKYVVAEAAIARIWSEVTGQDPDEPRISLEQYTDEEKAEGRGVKEENPVEFSL